MNDSLRFPTEGIDVENIVNEAYKIFMTHMPLNNPELSEEIKSALESKITETILLNYSIDTAIHLLAAKKSTIN